MMGVMERIGKWIDNFIRVIAQHGRRECEKCGTFNKKGYPCRCRIE